jgi:thiol:disulfide interchange protein
MTFLNRIFFTVLLAIATLLFSNTVYAKGAAQADTVSTADVDFTPIATARDSMAAKAKLQQQVPAAKTAIANAVPPSAEVKGKTLWRTFLEGLFYGFLAVLMPCLYPLLPLTVSFFLKLGGKRSKAIGLSIVYGLSIIAIYVSLGLLLSIWFGPDTMNRVATNGVFNLVVFILLVVFAISFLGAFEITLPSSLANKLDEKSDKGGLIGIFFMALTLVVVSFSCTGPVVAQNLFTAFAKGDRLAPAMGMLGFSLALAIPFTLFALFPSLLKSLPKSGGWLNSVKVFLGFLELALALKFLSNVDLAYHWNWFSREVCLSLWIAIGLLLTLYLLGKLKFSHDSDLPYLSVTRTFVAIFVLSFTVYLIPGLWGAPLKFISGQLPPMGTQDFDLSAGVSSAAAAPIQEVSIKDKKYEDVFLNGRHKGLNEWYDYDQVVQVSKELKKPILIDFTGWNCANCRKMEADVWSSAEVKKRLQNNFILLELYVDDKTELPPGEQYTSTFSGKRITAIGAKNSDYEAKNFNVNSQPYYVIIDARGKVLVPAQGADYSVENYIKFLDSGLTAYQNER